MSHCNPRCVWPLTAAVLILLLLYTRDKHHELKHALITCSACSQQVSPDMMQTHLAFGCTMRQQECRYCHMNVAAQELNEHVVCMRGTAHALVWYTRCLFMLLWVPLVVYRRTVVLALCRVTSATSPLPSSAWACTRP